MPDNQDKLEKLKTRIRQLVQDGNTEVALELVAKQQLGPIDNEIIILNSRYNQIQENRRLGIIDYSEAMQEVTKINIALIELVDKIKPESSIPNSEVLKVIQNIQPSQLFRIAITVLLISIPSYFILKGINSGPNPKPDIVKTKILYLNLEIPFDPIHYMDGFSLPDSLSIISLKDSVWKMYQKAITKLSIEQINLPDKKESFELVIDGNSLGSHAQDKRKLSESNISSFSSVYIEEINELIINHQPLDTISPTFPDTTKWYYIRLENNNGIFFIEANANGEPLTQEELKGNSEQKWKFVMGHEKDSWKIVNRKNGVMCLKDGNIRGSTDIILKDNSELDNNQLFVLINSGSVEQYAIAPWKVIQKNRKRVLCTGTSSYSSKNTSIRIYSYQNLEHQKLKFIDEDKF